MRAHAAAKVLAAVRGPAAIRRRVGALAARMGELAILYEHADGKPPKQLVQLVKERELRAQQFANSLGLTLCGPIGR
jgi:hypothetical protein